MQVTHCDVCDEVIRPREMRVRMVDRRLFDYKGAPTRRESLIVNITVNCTSDPGPMERPDLCDDCLADLAREAFPSSRAVPA